MLEIAYSLLMFDPKFIKLRHPCGKQPCSFTSPSKKAS